jgi:hypothetical protein
MKVFSLHHLSYLLQSSKFNSLLSRNRWLSFGCYLIFRIQYLYDKKDHTFRHVCGGTLWLDEVFLKFFEHYFFHQCYQHNFRQAYFTKYIIVNSISKKLIKTDQIPHYTIDIWMLIMASIEFRQFIGLPSDHADALLQERSLSQFRSLLEPLKPELPIRLLNEIKVKIIGPLDELNQIIDKFDQFICLKPYQYSGLTSKNGIFIPNNFTLKNRLSDCIKFQTQHANFETLVDVNQPRPKELVTTPVICQFSMCGSSLMGLQRSLLVAFICGFQKIDCTGFNFSIDARKYLKTYPSTFHTAQNSSALIAESNYKHDIVFNFLFTKITIHALFDSCDGDIKNIVNLDVSSFLSKFTSSNPTS